MPGSPIDPAVARRLAEVFERRPEVTDFERDLLNDAKRRYGLYGSKMHLSRKQVAVIDDVYVKMTMQEAEDL